MPTFHVSKTIGIRDDYDPLAEPSPVITGPSMQAPIVVDNTPLSPTTLLAIKIYAFGGLAFMFAIVVASVTYWIWVVIIKREFADSPPDLDLHPERMREREKARIARLKIKQEAKAEALKRKAEKKFRVPPLQYEQKEQKDRQRPSSVPIKPACRKSSLASANARKSCQSKGKRVSWAASTATLDSNGCLHHRPLQDKSETEKSRPTRSPRVVQSQVPLILCSQTPIISCLPLSRPSIPHVSTCIVARAPRGLELVGAMTPDMARRWAQTNRRDIR